MYADNLKLHWPWNYFSESFCVTYLLKPFGFSPDFDFFASRINQFYYFISVFRLKYLVDELWAVERIFIFTKRGVEDDQPFQVLGCIKHRQDFFLLLSFFICPVFSNVEACEIGILGQNTAEHWSVDLTFWPVLIFADVENFDLQLWV